MLKSESLTNIRLRGRKTARKKNVKRIFAIVNGNQQNRPNAVHRRREGERDKK